MCIGHAHSFCMNCAVQKGLRVVGAALQETPAILGTKSGASGSPRIPAVLLQVSAYCLCSLLSLGTNFWFPFALPNCIDQL